MRENDDIEIMWKRKDGDEIYDGLPPGYRVSTEEQRVQHKRYVENGLRFKTMNEKELIEPPNIRFIYKNYEESILLRRKVEYGVFSFFEMLCDYMNFNSNIVSINRVNEFNNSSLAKALDISRKSIDKYLNILNDERMIAKNCVTTNKYQLIINPFLAYKGSKVDPMLRETFAEYICLSRNNEKLAVAWGRR